MNHDTPITDADLHAYLDGQLSELRQLQVETWLKDHPDELNELAEYQSIDRELQNLLDPILDEALPESLKIKPRRNILGRVAAIAGLLFTGSLIGWQANTVMMAGSQSQQIQNNLLQPATFAHLIYTAEKKHPVEVVAAQEQHLIKWLSKRMHADIKAPNLSQHGYQLIGGRLLPSTNRMAAQFMYQNDLGNRVTLYVRRISEVNADALFRFTNNNKLNTFYWIEESLGYALSGELDKSMLMSMAKTTHEQLGLKI